MKLQIEDSNLLNLDFTLCCGQAFRWERHDKWWYGVVRNQVLKIRQEGNNLYFANANASFVRNYFGLNDDLPKIYSEIAEDQHIIQAINELKGLRILHQDSWECLISYICATYKNIPAIKKMIFNLSKEFGEGTQFNNLQFFTFPTPEKLAKATMKKLQICGLGYRAKYVSETAKLILDGDFDLEDLKREPYEAARKKLLKLPGVGRKVADCVLLFSLEKPEAFPIDIWIKRVIMNHYSNYFSRDYVTRISRHKSSTASEYEKLSTFGRQHFGRHAGYAQEYLYHFEKSKHSA